MLGAMKFLDLPLSEPVMSGIRDAGFEETTPVQEQTFAHTLNGRDVTVQSQTGTGKTAAFLVSLFQLMTEDERYKGARALIIAPTRELVVQIEEEAKLLGSHCGLSVGSIYGGVGYDKQLRMLQEGVDVIVGTPGRLIDLNQSKKLDFHDIGMLVIDEADRLFDMGFYPDIKKMLRKMRPHTERMTMLYSATLSNRVRNLSWEHMNNPAEIAIEPESMTVDKVEQQLFHVTRNDKFRLLLGLLRQEEPESAIIFCNTKHEVEDVSLRLRENGYSTEFMMGDLPQKKRLKIIEGIKTGSTPFLVATDVAARGLHVNDLDLVINYDLPEDPENYVHRIGRTARAGKSGRAISLACERFVYGLEPIEELIDQKIPAVIPAPADYADDITGGRRLQHSGSRNSQDRSRGSRDTRDSRDSRGGHRSSRGRSDRGSGPRDKAGSRSRDQTARSQGRSGAGAPSRDSAGGKPVASGRASGSGKSGGAGKPSDSSKPVATGKPGRDPATTARRAATRKPTDVQRDTDLDERLRYYREKYGEDFVPKDATLPKEDGTPAPGKPRRGRKRGSAPDKSGASDPNDRKNAHSGHSHQAPTRQTTRQTSSSEGLKQAADDERDSGAKKGLRGLLGRIFGRRGS